MHNPFGRYKVTQGWREGSHSTFHAIDYGTPKGTKFGAPTAGTYRRMPTNPSRTNPTSPGVWAQLLLDDGRRIVFCHLDHHIAADGQRVVEGQILAATGNTGYVRPRPSLMFPTLGAHMHTYGLTKSNARWNWTVDADAAPSGTGVVRRRASHTAAGRRYASRKAKHLQTIRKGKTGTFRGFVIGDSVTAHGITTNIWYVGKSRSNRFWAGNFTVVSTGGLRDLTGIVK